jgi:ArsR family transcriptional regulator, arsenate/arsenite/antimonite-responsive transcriptional repressor
MVQAFKRKAGGVSCCGSLQDLLSPKLFKALSDPKRLSLLVRLAESREPCTVGVVAEGSGIDLSVVSRHLAILREAGVIRCDKQGKEVRCVVQTDVVAKILRGLADALDACCPTGTCPAAPTNRVDKPKARRRPGPK